MLGTFDYPVGTVIPGTPYRITMCIATGGMGAVYQVEDTGVGKQFALKTLHGALAGNVATEQRMREEALTLGRLTHPNIVQVFTAGVTTDSRKLPYIVMERLVGSTLRELIEKRGALDLRSSIVIALQLLTALDEAHDLGLVHRDIKPDNVFLHRPRRGERMTKLLDFGVADLVAKANEAPHLFFGTFKYASPEQLKTIPISQACDLYSAGLVIYEMLAGQFAFPHVRKREELIKAHLTETPKFPSACPESIRSIVASALEKAPEARPKDAFTFAAKLRRAARDLGLDVEGPLLEDELFPKPSLDGDETRAGEPVRSPKTPDASFTRVKLLHHEDDAATSGGTIELSESELVSKSAAEAAEEPAPETVRNVGDNVGDNPRR